jgi:putative transposase
MARIPRTQYLQANGYYHVISRTINQALILKAPEDFQYFKKLMHQAKQQFPLSLFHYALMGTHFHFVVQTIKPDDLAGHLRYLKWSYTQWARKKYGWKGPLWRERYRSLAIQDEAYLAACGLYVECNPVRAGLCQEPSDYPYSSARKYFLGQPDDLLDPYTPAPVPESLALAARNPLAADLVFTGAGGHQPRP